MLWTIVIATAVANALPPLGAVHAAEFVYICCMQHNIAAHIKHYRQLFGHPFEVPCGTLLLPLATFLRFQVLFWFFLLLQVYYWSLDVVVARWLATPHRTWQLNKCLRRCCQPLSITFAGWLAACHRSPRSKQHLQMLQQLISQLVHGLVVRTVSVSKCNATHIPCDGRLCAIRLGAAAWQRWAPRQLNSTRSRHKCCNYN